MFFNRQVWTSTHQRVSMLEEQTVTTGAVEKGKGIVTNLNSIHNTEKCLHRVCVTQLVQALEGAGLVVRVEVLEPIAINHHICRGKETDNREVIYFCFLFLFFVVNILNYLYKFVHVASMKQCVSIILIPSHLKFNTIWIEWVPWKVICV